MTTGKSSKTEPLNAATEPEERRDSSTGKAERVEKKRQRKGKDRGIQGEYIRVRGNILRIPVPAEGTKVIDDHRYRIHCLPVPQLRKTSDRIQPARPVMVSCSLN
jgi:hypothetical protein